MELSTTMYWICAAIGFFYIAFVSALAIAIIAMIVRDVVEIKLLHAKDRTKRLDGDYVI